MANCYWLYYLQKFIIYSSDNSFLKYIPNYKIKTTLGFSSSDFNIVSYFDNQSLSIFPTNCCSNFSTTTLADSIKPTIFAYLVNSTLEIFSMALVILCCCPTSKITYNLFHFTKAILDNSRFFTTLVTSSMAYTIPNNLLASIFSTHLGLLGIKILTIKFNSYYFYIRFRERSPHEEPVPND